MMKKKGFCGFLAIAVFYLFFLFGCSSSCPQGQVLFDGVCTDIDEVLSSDVNGIDSVEKDSVNSVIEKVIDSKDEIEDVVVEKDIISAGVDSDDVNDLGSVAFGDFLKKDVISDDFVGSAAVLNNLKNAYERNVKSFEFGFDGRHYMVYKLSDDSVGDLIKVGLYNSDVLRGFNVNGSLKDLIFFDVIYVDLNIEDKFSSSVSAYCEGSFDKNVLANCVKSFLIDVPLNISYNFFKDNYEIMLPSEHLYFLLSGNVLIRRAEEGKYTLKNRAVTVVETVDGKRYYFDPYLGLPLKIEYDIGGSLIVVNFNNLIGNKLKLVQMSYRTASDIPPSEMFYL